jgi:hypothetical protein
VLDEIDLYATWAGLEADGSIADKAEHHRYATNKGRENHYFARTFAKKPVVKPKPWHLRGLQALREKSPFRPKSRSESPNSTFTAGSPRSKSNASTENSATSNESLQKISDVHGSHCLQDPPSGKAKSISKSNRNSNETSQRRPLQMSGIFFDETPNNYSDAVADYLECVIFGVKNSMGIGGPKLVSTHFLTNPLVLQRF